MTVLPHSRTGPSKFPVPSPPLPEYRARVNNGGIIIFFAHPMTRDLRLPLRFGQLFTDQERTRDVTLAAAGRSLPLKVAFKPYQSLRIQKCATGNSFEGFR
jgi:hypothetical protein